MAKKNSKESPYIPSYAGLIRFREEKAKIVLKPKVLYTFILLFVIIILTLHLLYY